MLWCLSCVVSQLCGISAVWCLDNVVFVGNARNFGQAAFTMLMAA